MDNTRRGKLILRAVPAGEPEEKVVALLQKFAKKASAIELTQKVRNAPYTLSNDIEAEKANLFIETFNRWGANAVFVPHIIEKSADEQPTPAQRPPVFSFESDDAFIDEPAPPPIHVKPPRKNGVRRLTIILTIILLLLCLGFLTWQLWPIIGVKIQEIIN